MRTINDVSGAYSSLRFIVRRFGITDPEHIGKDTCHERLDLLGPVRD